MSDISQDENPFDQNNNNNEKDTNTTDNQTGVTGDVQNSSDSSNTLVNPSPSGPLDDTAPDGLGGTSGNAAVSGGTASRGPASGSPASGRPSIQGDPQGMVSNVDDTVHSTAPSVDGDVQGVLTSTPQSLSGQVSAETGMEFCHTDQETESAMSEDDNESDEPQLDLMDRAAAIVNHWIGRIMGGREAVLVLPRADPVIPLVKEIANQA